jgi:hypothetical protein
VAASDAISNDARQRRLAEDRRQEDAIGAGLEIRLENEVSDATWVARIDPEVRAAMADLDLPITSVRCGSTLCAFDVDISASGVDRAFVGIMQHTRFRAAFSGDVWGAFGEGIQPGHMRLFAARDHGELHVSEFFASQGI